LQIKAGETTPDGKFSLEAAECLATCDGAPSLQINYEDFYRVTPEIARRLVKELEAGLEVRGERGDAVKDSSAISREVALAGVRIPHGEAEDMRTIGGETPRVDTAPGFRPKEKGHKRSDDGGE
jgi:NADH-quinone oxidoreductase subunit E